MIAVRKQWAAPHLLGRKPRPGVWRPAAAHPLPGCGLLSGQSACLKGGREQTGWVGGCVKALELGVLAPCAAQLAHLVFETLL